jgi:two-component system catabolic regulation response regulator CreB
MSDQPARVLVVEDEAAIADTLLYALRSEGYAAEHCALGRQALATLRADGADVVVLDVGLPDLGGFEVCRELRTFSQVPVIFLTARNDEFDRVLGLELGADDYVTKPFSPRELVARVRARLRRSVPAPSTPASAGWKVHGAFAIDGEGRRIRYRDTPLDLTRYEYALLSAAGTMPATAPTAPSTPTSRRCAPSCARRERRTTRSAPTVAWATHWKSRCGSA